MIKLCPLFVLVCKLVLLRAVRKESKSFTVAICSYVMVLSSSHYLPFERVLVKVEDNKFMSRLCCLLAGTALLCAHLHLYGQAVVFPGMQCRAKIKCDKERFPARSKKLV
jgi:hypothetical protein